jgi:hypothetical protein
MSAALVLGALLAAACVVLVALPYLREPQAVRDVLDEPSEVDRRRLELAETRDRALGALKELELDHRTGKVSDEDYRALVGPLRREAAEALRALEPRAGAQERVRVERSGYPPGMEPIEVPEPYPPPDEADPPEPVVIPEPYPSPDEGDPPEPAIVPEIPSEQ